MENEAYANQQFLSDARKLVPRLNEVDAGPSYSKALFAGVCADLFNLYFKLYEDTSRTPAEALKRDIGACVKAVWDYADSGGNDSSVIQDALDLAKEMPLHDYDRDGPPILFALAQMPSIGLACTISFLAGGESARAKYVSSVLFDVLTDLRSSIGKDLRREHWQKI